MKEIGILGLVLIPILIFFSWVSLLVTMAIAEAAIYSKLTYERLYKTNKPEPVKTAESVAKPIEYKTFASVKPEDGWKCSCGHENNKYDRFCINCGKYK